MAYCINRFINMSVIIWRIYSLKIDNVPFEMCCFHLMRLEANAGSKPECIKAEVNVIRIWGFENHQIWFRTNDSFGLKYKIFCYLFFIMLVKPIRLFDLHVMILGKMTHDRLPSLFLLHTLYLQDKIHACCTMLYNLEHKYNEITLLEILKSNPGLQIPFWHFIFSSLLNYLVMWMKTLKQLWLLMKILSFESRGYDQHVNLNCMH